MHAIQQKLLDLAKKEDFSRLSYRAIARQIDVKYPQSIIHHLGQLRKKGLLYFDEQKRQRVAKPGAFIVDKFFNIPVYGLANCGPALEFAQDDIQGYLKISSKVLEKSAPNGLIAVRAVGDSLNKASINGDNIENGDYVIIDCKKQPENKDYILSIIDGAANLKKYFKDKNSKEIRLISESTLDIPPIVLHEDDLETSGYTVNGVVVRVIKN